MLLVETHFWDDLRPSKPYKGAGGGESNSASTGATQGAFAPCGPSSASPLSRISIRNAGTSSRWPTRSCCCAGWCSCRWAWCCPTAAAPGARRRRPAGPSSPCSRGSCPPCPSSASSGPVPRPGPRIKSSSGPGSAGNEPAFQKAPY